MILDRNLRFSNAQSVAASAASTDYIDLMVTAPIIGEGSRPVSIYIVVTTAIVGDTVVVTLQTDAATSFDTGPTTAQTIGTIPSGAAIGYALTVPFEIDGVEALDRYIRLYYTDSGSVSAGAVTAFLATN